MTTNHHLSTLSRNFRLGRSGREVGMGWNLFLAFCSNGSSIRLLVVSRISAATANSLADLRMRNSIRRTPDSTLFPRIYTVKADGRIAVENADDPAAGFGIHKPDAKRSPDYC